MWWSAFALALTTGFAWAQLPPEAVQLDKVKIAEKIKTTQFDPVTGELADEKLPTFEYKGVTYGQSKAMSKEKFEANPEKFHSAAEEKRWLLNFTHNMSIIWCPVTDEISPGGNTLWNEIGLVWESCCQFCNDTKAPEDFPRALSRLQVRAADAFKLQGVKYVNDASSPVEGAIDLGGGFDPAPAAVADEKPAFEPAWLKNETLTPTWTGGIGKLVENRCVACHRPGGAAPMPMMSVGGIRKWSKNLKTHIEMGTMPPWPGDPSMSFANGKNLTQKEKDVFLEWIAAGYPQGEGEFTFEKDWSKSPIGEADAVVKLGEYTMGDDVAEHSKVFEVATSFDEDKWVIATEVTPTDTFLTMEMGGGALGSYHRGNSTTELPEGTGYLIKKGETIKAHVFYTKEEGWEESDTDSQFALKFAESGSGLKALHTARLSNDDINIPAGKKDVSLTATYTFEADGQIVSFNPVMRQRGKSVKITAKTPNGSEETLVNIPRWDINWHFNYALVEAFDAPKGTVVTVTGTYDNSEMNAANPDASVDVKTGGELLEGWMSYTLN
jgi:YHS domain-containing protein